MFAPSQQPFRAAAVFSSPLQIRNAFQAFDAYGISDKECLKIFLPGTNVENRERCRKLLDSLTWNDVFLIDAPSVSEIEDQLEHDCQMLSSLAVIEWIAKTIPQRLEYVFMGDYRPRLFLHITNLLNPSKIVVLDDGSIVPEIADYRVNYLNPTYSNTEISKHRAKQGLVSFPSRKLLLNEPEALEFFTIYRLKVPLQDRIRRNLVARDTLDIAQTTREKQVWLIGTNHVEEGITSHGRYIGHLQKILQHYRGTPVIYYAHRREDATKLCEISKLLKIEIRKAEEGVEAEILVGRKLPTRIATIVSTVTDTIGDISLGRYPVDCFVPDQGYLGLRRREHIMAIIGYQRQNQHLNTNFWDADSFGEGGHVDAEMYDMKELNLLTSSPLVGVPAVAHCAWVDDEGIFGRDIDVELSAEHEGLLDLVVVDPSQPFLHEGDEYFLIDRHGCSREIKLRDVKGLSLTATTSVGILPGSSDCRSAPEDIPIWKRAIGALNFNRPTDGGSSAEKVRFALRAKWRHGLMAPGVPRLPAGFPLGKGTEYLSLANASTLGLSIKASGGKLQELDGLLLDPWGKFTSTRFAETESKGLHLLKVGLDKRLEEGEHLSFILQNGGRAGLCVRVYHCHSGHAGNHFLDLSRGGSQTVSLNDSFDGLVDSIAVDRLNGNWLRLTIVGGSDAGNLDRFDFVLQNKFCGSSIYLGSFWRGIYLDRIARGFGRKPLLPVAVNGKDPGDTATGGLLPQRQIAELNILLAFVSDERRFVMIELAGEVLTFDLRPEVPLPRWLTLENRIALNCVYTPGVTATLNLHMKGGCIHASTTEESVIALKSKSDRFDIKIIDDVLSENVAPLLAGMEIFGKPLREEDRKRCLYRRKLVPLELYGEALLEDLTKTDEDSIQESPKEADAEPNSAENANGSL